MKTNKFRSSKGKKSNFTQNRSKPSVDKANGDEAYKGKRKDMAANDPEWYLTNGVLAKNVSSFSFNDPLGGINTRIPANDGNRNLTITRGAFPGIAAIAVGPSVGISTDRNSPINLAASDIYSYVRHANSGHANYDPADLMIYLMAADSVQSFWSFMVRAYGVLNTFSQLNRYVGDAMLKAMGLNYSDFRNNISQFRAYINQFALRASVIAVPNTMSYYRRHNWLFQNIYQDEDNPKAQMYMYIPAYLYRFDLDSNLAGKLTAVPVSYSSYSAGGFYDLASLTVANVKALGDAFLNNMLSQEDIGIMSGDILKAYGSESLYRFSQIEDDYAIAPVFKEEVLAQIHNTKFAGYNPIKLKAGGGDWVMSISTLDVTQDLSIGSGALIFQPSFANADRLIYDQYLDFWDPDPSPELALVGSRNILMATAKDGQVESAAGVVQTGYTACTLTSCGSEIPIDVNIVYIDTLGRILNTKTFRPSSNGFALIDTIYTTKFNQFPLLDNMEPDPNVTGGQHISMPYGEISNYTVLGYQAVHDMHQCALLSMFGVPYKW